MRTLKLAVAGYLGWCLSSGCGEGPCASTGCPASGSCVSIPGDTCATLQNSVCQGVDASFGDCVTKLQSGCSTKADWDGVDGFQSCLAVLGACGTASSYGPALAGCLSDAGESPSCGVALRAEAALLVGDAGP
jgi:hypothetical protein